MFPTWSDWDIKYTRKGLFKKSAFMLLKAFAFLALLFGIIQRKQSNLGLKTKAFVRTLIFSSAGLLQLAGSKI